jgi:hypothetical protein
MNNRIKPLSSFITKRDLLAVETQLRDRLKVMRENINNENWPAVCADFRALSDQATDGCRMSASLSFHCQQKRFSSN